ncbi:MAG: Wzz/FepE/Etk N-terminal domain-containing protein [Nitrospirota bacterium]|nr:Wzz/FepE/Etk N-terminal domain-containing protein [Nitrospirota bacterium]
MDIYIRYFRILQRNRLWVGMIWAGVFAGAVLVAMVLPNIYQSTTMILVERQKVPEAYVRTTVTESMQERLKTITQEILSRNQIRQIIRDYQLLDRPVFEERLITRMDLSDEGVAARLLRGIAGIRIRESDLSDAAQLEMAVDEFKQHVTVKVVGNQAFSVTYEGQEPVTVMQITNDLAGMFITENLRVREARAESTTDFLEHQLEKARVALEERENARQAFRTANMGSLPEQMGANLHTLDRLQAESQRVESRLGVLAQQRSFIQSQILADHFNLADLPEETRLMLAQLDPLSRELAIAEERLANLRTRYTERHPEIIQLESQVDELREAVAQRRKSGDGDDQNTGLHLARIDRDETELLKKRENLEQDIIMYQQRVERTPKVEQELQKLERDYKIMQANYQSLLEKKMDARLAESLERRQQGEQFRVIDSANLPVEPVRPNRKIILLFGLFAGLGLGGGWFILLDMLRPTFQSPEDVTALLGLPVLMATSQVKEFDRVK